MIESLLVYSLKEVVSSGLLALLVFKTHCSSFYQARPVPVMALVWHFVGSYKNPLVLMPIGKLGVLQFCFHEY